MVIKKVKELIGLVFAKRQYSSMVKNINFGNPSNILDVGGSLGIFGLEVAKKLHKKISYTVIDVDKNSLREGKEKYKEFNFEFQDAEKMTFRDKEFDLVICKDVLHHCQNPEKAISEIKRVGEKYIIIEARRGDKWLDDYLKGHNHFTEEKFKNLVKPEKFSFLDTLWPRFRYMVFFVLFPIIPKSKKSFMVGYS